MCLPSEASSVQLACHFMRLHYASLGNIEAPVGVLIAGFGDLTSAGPSIGLIDAPKVMGIRVMVDDFGIGFSSLSYLRDLPIHKHKLDRAFIKYVATNRSNAAIAQGIITMAHHLDLVVVAEGIEEGELQLQQDLIRCHCDLLQGFYFARPKSREAVMALPGSLPPSPAR